MRLWRWNREQERPLIDTDGKVLTRPSPTHYWMAADCGNCEADLMVQWPFGIAAPEIGNVLGGPCCVCGVEDRCFRKSKATHGRQQVGWSGPVPGDQMWGIKPDAPGVNTTLA